MISEIHYIIKEDLTNDEIDKLALLFNHIINTIPDSLDNSFILNKDKLAGIEDNNNIGQLFYLNTHKGIYVMNHMLQDYSFIIKSFLLCSKKISNKIIVLDDENWKKEELFSFFINKKIV